MRFSPIEILLVEDRPDTVQLMRAAFEHARSRFRLRVASSGEAARDCIHRCGPWAGGSCPDLILLNYGVSGGQGSELLRELKSCPETRNIPVIILTSAGEQVVHQAYDQHANCCVAMPDQLDELCRVVQAVDSFWFHTAELPERPL